MLPLGPNPAAPLIVRTSPDEPRNDSPLDMRTAPVNRLADEAEPELMLRAPLLLESPPPVPRVTKPPTASVDPPLAPAEIITLPPPKESLAPAKSDK